MNLRLPFLFLMLGFICPLRAGDLSADTFWIGLQQELSSRAAVRAQFSERRSHPMRQRDTFLSGTLRYSSRCGLSLAYDGPLGSVIIIDETGLHRRTGEGAQPLPLPEEMAAIHQAMLAALRLDFDALQGRFSMEARHEPEGTWILNLTPRDATAFGSLRALQIEGEEGRITGILMDLGVRRRVEINIHEPEYPAAFSPEETAAFFQCP